MPESPPPPFASAPPAQGWPTQSRPLVSLLQGLALPHHHLRPCRAPIIALVGAGGKTTLLYALGRALAAAQFKVITTTTTHIFPPAPADSPQCLLSPSPAALRQALSLHGHVTVAEASPCVSTQQSTHTKLTGLSFESIAALRAVADVVLVEADGAAMHPLKAPAPHEPAVPPCTQLCIAVCGLAGLGHPVQDSVHRPERATALCACLPHHLVEPAHLAHLALHPQGLFRTTPTTARRAVLCTLPPHMPASTGVQLARQAAQTARQLYPTENIPWWAGSACAGWLVCL